MIYDAIKAIRSYRAARKIVSKTKDTLYLLATTTTTMSPLFSEYSDLIEPLANIDTIEILEQESPEYTKVAETADYKLYFKS